MTGSTTSIRTVSIGWPVLAFADALARARAEIITDPVEAIVAEVAERFSVTADPRSERGYKGTWHVAELTGGAVTLACRLLVQGAGMTLRDAGERMGYSSGAAHNWRRPPTLREYELDVLDAAMLRLPPRHRVYG